MDKDKKKRLEAAGWKVGDTQEFLSLSDAEMAFIDMKIALAGGLRASREDRNLTQAEVAKLVGSSQSRVAKMESAAPSVSMDLMVRTLLKIGTSRTEIAKLLTRSKSKKSAA